MKAVKEFFEEFAEYEAKMEVLKFQLDVTPYNEGRDNGNSYYVEPNVKYMPQEPWDEDEIEFMGDSIGKPKKRYPRALFKISQYSHDKYGDVWLCFCSLPDHSERKPTSLTEILFILKDKGQLKIASQYSYSDYESDGKHYEWGKDNVAHHDLKLEDLKGPLKIERYQEPDDYLDGKMHYNNDW